MTYHYTIGFWLHPGQPTVLFKNKTKVKITVVKSKKRQDTCMCSLKISTCTPMCFLLSFKPVSAAMLAMNSFVNPLKLLQMWSDNTLYKHVKVF